VVISFTRSDVDATGAAGDLSHYAFVGSTAGTVTTVGAPIQLQAGQVNNYHLIGGSGERWGDYRPSPWTRTTRTRSG